MTANELGAWLMVGLGAATVAAAILASLRKIPAPTLGLMWLFGMALLGVGSYGPVFLSDYEKLTRSVVDLLKAPTGDNAEAVVVAASQEDIPEEARRAAIRVAYETAPRETEQAIVQIMESRPSVEARPVLEDELAKIKAESAAQAVGENLLKKTAVDTAALDSTDREILAPVLEVPDEQAERLGLDQAGFSKVKAEVSRPTN
ncbi:MAG: hypothetical protein ACREMK_06575 [Gemmatimonadota bacterium]